jgi:hypothetical protein
MRSSWSSWPLASPRRWRSSSYQPAQRPAWWPEAAISSLLRLQRVLRSCRRFRRCCSHRMPLRPSRSGRRRRRHPPFPWSPSRRGVWPRRHRLLWACGKALWRSMRPRRPLRRRRPPNPSRPPPPDPSRPPPTSRNHPHPPNPSRHPPRTSQRSPHPPSPRARSRQKLAARPPRQELRRGPSGSAADQTMAASWPVRRNAGGIIGVGRSGCAATRALRRRPSQPPSGGGCRQPCGHVRGPTTS